MDAIWTLLPFLVFLACPLMMVFCMFGMGKLGRGTAQPETQVASQLPEERVAALQQQLQTIQAELTALQPAPVPPPALALVSGDERLVEVVPVVPGTAHAARHTA